MAEKKMIPTVEADGQEWYTAGGAAASMSKRAGRLVKPAYLRSLARLGKVATKKIDESTVLYLKSDVDAYVVESRGQKAARVMSSRKGTKAEERQGELLPA